MININDYPNIASALRRIAQMQELSAKGGSDALDDVIEACCPLSRELTEEELELASAAVKEIDLPEYLKKDDRIM